MMNLTRKQQMIWLSFLTAITLTGQYALVGNTIVGITLPSWFGGLEVVLWALRAVVEVAVVVYVGMTVSQNWKQEAALWTFKGLLIVLIVATVGPVLAEHAMKQPITAIFGWHYNVTLNMLLSGVSATMLAAVSYAYRVQPYDDPLPDTPKPVTVRQKPQKPASDHRETAATGANDPVTKSPEEQTPEERERNLAVANATRVPTQEDYDKAAYLRAEGMTWPQVGREIGRSTKTAVRWASLGQLPEGNEAVVTNGNGVYQ